MKRRERVGWRVGLLVLVALIVAAVAIILVGGQNHLFRRMRHYVARFENVKGLQEGSPVQLNGVAVGRVEGIVLSREAGDHLLTVKIAIDQRYQAHVRSDSLARIKTLGLLGDRYVEITAGQATASQLSDGQEIQAVQAANVDALIDSGTDVVDNVEKITVALAKILERVERGEGLLGQLMAPVPEADKDLSLIRSMRHLAESLERITVALDQGRSPVARLLLDEKMGDQLGNSVDRLDRLMVDMTEGEGLLPGVLHDTELRAKAERSLANLEKSTADLAAVTSTLRSDEGLLPKLLNDEVFATEVTRELQELLSRLDRLVAALENGEGTAGKLIQDPSIYDAVNDVVVGVNESKMLRWLVRNRQKAGIKRRYRDAQAQPAPAADPQNPAAGADPLPNPVPEAQPSGGGSPRSL